MKSILIQFYIDFKTINFLSTMSTQQELGYGRFG